MKTAFSLRGGAALLVPVTLAFMSACSTAKVQDTWTAPDVTQLNFKKILVIAATQDGNARRITEDAVAATSRVQCVPSYTLIPDVSDLKSLDRVTAAIKGDNFDGVVVMRMLSQRDKVTVTQDAGMMYPMGYPVGYRYFGGYYGAYALGGYGYGFGPGFGPSTTVTTDRITQIETNIYEMPGGKLVWSATTESTSPDNTKQLVDDVVAALKKELIKDKLIPSAKG
jgi:hypothetical protein